MVQNVKGVKLKLEFQLLSQAGCLKGAEVKGNVTWPAERVPSSVSKYLGISGNSKGIDVEPLLDRARPGGTHARHDGTHVFFKIGARVDGWPARNETRKRKASAQHRDSADLPSPRNFVQHPGPAVSPALLRAKGKFVEGTSNPIVLYVKYR